MNIVRVVVVVMAVFPLVVVGFDGTWEPIGPDGGDFVLIKTNPTNASEVIALSRDNSTVYYSANGGTSWSMQGKTPASYIYDACAYDSYRLFVLYSTICYRSTDGGITWNSSYLPSTFGYPYEICVHPSSSNLVYAAGVNYDMSGGYKLAFFKSTDGGVTWIGTNSSQSFDYVSPYDIQVSKTNPDVIYVCGIKQTSSAYYGLLFKSSDGGATWADLSSNVDTTQYNYFTCLAIDPTSESRVYIGGTYFYYSINGGSTFIRSSQAMNMYSLAIDPTAPAKLYAAGSGTMMNSTDYGVVWLTRYNVIKGAGYSLEVAPATPSTLYTATYLGLFKSTDSCSHWSTCHNGILNSDICAISISRSNPSIIFAEHVSWGVRATTNGGTTWLDKGYFVDCGNLCDILIHPTNPNIIYGLKDG